LYARSLGASRTGLGASRPPKGLVREERETKTAASRKIGL